MLINPKFDYPSMLREEKDGTRKYMTPGGKSVPSVTTILSATADKSFLTAWADRVGADEAARIKNEAAAIGTAMHLNLENYIYGKKMSGMPLSVILANLIIKKGLSNVSEIWAVEAPLFCKGLYAGTTDSLGIHQNNESIIDYKNSIREKKKEWIGDYFIQLAAYKMCHDEMFGTNISRCIIMMATRDAKYQEFIIEGQELASYTYQWAKRLEKYYQLYPDG